MDTLDRIDCQILAVLQQQGRISNRDLAARVHLSPPACLARVRRLEDEGYIEGYHALLKREALGFDQLCFIQLTLELHRHEHIARLLEQLIAMPEVLECYNLTGEYDYLLKVAVPNTMHLHNFISKRLFPIPGIARIHTSVVLKEVKRSTVLPLDCQSQTSA